mmetsp:Transcript_24410/g.59226  ORF Transcript_24410/g.59226 Transcript_24410/m.59226 type:complete len:152 (-) Transcript_24410:84-539(-)
MGAYGEGSDDQVWPQREPFAGKSEQVASGASETIHELVKELGAAKANSNRLQTRLARVEKVAMEGAEATAQQRADIEVLESELKRQTGAARRMREGLDRYGGGGALQQDSAPFYDLKGHGGRSTESAVRFFEDHPNQVKRDVGPHAIASRD